MTTPTGQGLAKSAKQITLNHIFTGILGEFVSMGAKMLADWGAKELMKTSIAKDGSLIRLALEKMGFVESATAKVATDGIEAGSEVAKASVVIPAEAGIAASGAAAAVAPTPIVGPVLAAAAFAATMAMVLGAKKSAAGGFDIPSGLNPVTQLHQEEMVLPAHIANPLRDSLAAGGTGGGDVHVHLHAGAMLDPHGVSNFFQKNSHTLAPALRTLARNFTPTKS